MSDQLGKGGIPPGGDPLFDPNDPAAVEREERRREREAKRAQKRGKKVQKNPPPLSAPKPPPPPAAPPRTPEQEFWDEPAEPTPPPPGAEPGGKAPADDEKAGRGRRGLLRRRKGKAAAAGAAGAAAGGAAAAQGASPSAPPTGEGAAVPAPPTGESSATSAPATAESPAAPSSPTTESPSAASGPPIAESPAAASGPPTGEAPVAPAGPPTTESPLPPASPPTAEAPAAPASPPTAEAPAGNADAPVTGEHPAAGPATAEQPIPPLSEAQRGPTADAPRVDPGDHTAEAPRPDPNQPTGENLVPGPATGEHFAPPPRPLEETGAGDWEPPPPRDDDWFDDDEPFHDDGDPMMAGAARTGRRHGEDGGGRFGGPLGSIFRHPFRLLGVVVLILILLFLNAFFQPFHGEGSGKVVVKIPKGSSVGEVGELLEKKGVISSGFIIDGSTFFQARVTLAGDRSNLIAGKHVMKKDMSYGDAIDELTKESTPVEVSKPGVIDVTIPEGQSRPITAKLLKEDGIKGNYMKATKKSKVLNPEEYGGKNVKDLEGFLYPDTWEYNTRKPVKNLVALQLQDFKKKIKKVNMKYAKSKNLTVFDVVTIASMIEREAGVPKQRKLVSSVIYNRLHEGMTLGIDSTIRFATGNYERPLTQSELESNSPYNTRKYPGLPPGPINSPGLAALNAAAHPAKTDYLFYVNNPNSCNELAFAKTEEEFLADAARYEQAREKNGGNEPSTCK